MAAAVAIAGAFERLRWAASPTLVSCEAQAATRARRLEPCREALRVILCEMVSAALTQDEDGPRVEGEGVDG